MVMSKDTPAAAPRHPAQANKTGCFDDEVLENRYPCTHRGVRGLTTKAKNISGPPSLGNFADHRLPGTEGIRVESLNSMGKRTTAKRPVPHRRL